MKYQCNRTRSIRQAEYVLELKHYNLEQEKILKQKSDQQDNMLNISSYCMGSMQKKWWGKAPKPTINILLLLRCHLYFLRVLADKWQRIQRGGWSPFLAPSWADTAADHEATEADPALGCWFLLNVFRQSNFNLSLYNSLKTGIFQGLILKWIK